MPYPRIVLLGTNGWYSTALGNTLSVLLQTKDCDIVLDAGSGFATLDRYADGLRPVFLFLSHFHLDHIIGLHTLSKFRFPQGLFIHTPAGGRAILSRFLNRPFTMPLADIPYPIEIIEYPHLHPQLPCEILALPLEHADPVLGIRVVLDKKVVSFCTDTGLCENAFFLARQADVLLTECSLKIDELSSGWPHLNPSQAGEIAQKSDAKKLVLVHFNPQNYPGREHRIKAEQSAQTVFPEAFSGFDHNVIRF